ncbi:DNA polymerase III subunit delta [Hyphomonas johnsonii]|uniref:DNA-directed DNA polymerase n=1 Tax=Hyphomonas johnsonii MHS-2 TaxID=1280950 RepID=A0A059FMK5_9PROT|nr:DNA polymerase III subunit delta [Hyphomonas johnsonii]KCZ91761.1 DNA polymerase III subunit delta [Hyphomonas johnsonii MHS-2]
MLLKGKQAVTFSRRPGPEFWAVLAFGDDPGLASDAAASLIKAWTPKSGDIEVISLDDDSIRKDPALLFDNLEAVSLLGEPRVIRVRTSGDKIAALLAEALTEGDRESGRYAARLVIEAGSLQSRSKLRGAAMSARLAACLQLFADEAEDIESRVKAALLEVGASMDADALHAFTGDLPGHRGIANAEIEKLALYARGLGRNLAMADIRALSATDIDHDLSATIRATLDGNIPAAHTALQRLDVAGTSPISVLRSLQSETLRMLDAHAKIAAGQANPGMKLRPPVWQSDWPAFRARLAKWPPKRLARILERIYEAERQAKSGGASASPVVRVLITELARAAAAA